MLKQNISNYTLKRKIRSNGVYYSVWEADQIGLPRPVEIRLLHHQMDKNSAECKRFAYQFKTLAALEHPNILRVLDVGMVKDHLFYVTDLRNSRSLDELMNDDKFHPTIREALETARAMGRALKHLHSRGVIHRDITARSIYLDLDTMVPFIGEFSMVKNLNLAELTSAGIPQMFAFIQTPEFGAGQELDERTDLFLLGKVIYQLLVLEQSREARREKRREKRRDSGETGIDEDEGMSPGRRNPEVPSEVDQLIRDLTRSAPDERIQTAAVFLDMLDAAIESVVAREQLSRMAQSYKDTAVQSALDKHHETVAESLARKTQRMEIQAIESTAYSRRTRISEVDEASTRSHSRWPKLWLGLLILGLTGMGVAASAAMMALGTGESAGENSRDPIPRPDNLTYRADQDYELIVVTTGGLLKTEPTNQKTFQERWTQLDNWVRQKRERGERCPVQGYELGDIRDELHRDGPRAARMLDAVFRRILAFLVAASEQTVTTH